MTSNNAMLYHYCISTSHDETAIMKGQENQEGFEVNRHISFWCVQIIFYLLCKYVTNTQREY